MRQAARHTDEAVGVAVGLDEALEVDVGVEVRVAVRDVVLVLDLVAVTAYAHCRDGPHHIDSHKMDLSQRSSSPDAEAVSDPQIRLYDPTGTQLLAYASSTPVPSSFKGGSKARHDALGCPTTQPGPGPTTTL
jgi:hypothetical protein